MKKELLNGLTKEQIEKVKACKSQDELLKLAKEENIELTDEQLAAVSGGACTNTAYGKTCPKCGSTRMVSRNIFGGAEYECRDCGHTYTHHAWDGEGSCF